MWADIWGSALPQPEIGVVAYKRGILYYGLKPTYIEGVQFPNQKYLLLHKGWPFNILAWSQDIFEEVHSPDQKHLSLQTIWPFNIFAWATYNLEWYQIVRLNFSCMYCEF